MITLFIDIVAPRLDEPKGGLKIDNSLATVDSIMYDAVYIPGGKESVTVLLGDYEARHFVRDACNHGKAIARYVSRRTAFLRAPPKASSDGTDLALKT